MYQNIADLHEEILCFLLKYKELLNKSSHSRTQKRDFTFALRDDKTPENRAALEKGWWFYGDEKTVEIYFLYDTQKIVFENNIRIVCALDGAISIEFLFSDKDSQIQEVSPDDFLFQRYEKESTIKHIIYDMRLPLAIADRLGQTIKRIDSVLEFQKSDFLIPSPLFDKQLQTIQSYRTSFPIHIHLADFALWNYKNNIKNLEITNLPDSKWIFLTGENGFGKTLILQALATALYKYNEISRSDFLFSVTYNTLLTNNRVLSIENKTVAVFPELFRPLESLACYGAVRVELQATESMNQANEKSTNTYSLFHTDGILKNIETELLFSFYENDTKFRTIETMLKDIIPNLAKIEIDKEHRRVLYYEKDTNSENGADIYPPVQFSQLALGIRGLIAMVGDIYLRLGEVQRKGSQYPAPSDLYGIVIIDELDAHLHPKWQRKLPTMLSSVFPNVQFIASTHSPIPLLGAPAGAVFLKVNRTKEEGITVERLEYLEKEISNLLPNAILTSEIFDFREIIPQSHQPNERLETEDDYAKIRIKRLLQGYLRELANGNSKKTLQEFLDEKL